MQMWWKQFKNLGSEDKAEVEKLYLILHIILYTVEIQNVVNFELNLSDVHLSLNLMNSNKIKF